MKASLMRAILVSFVLGSTLSTQAQAQLQCPEKFSLDHAERIFAENERVFVRGWGWINTLSIEKEAQLTLVADTYSEGCNLLGTPNRDRSLPELHFVRTGDTNALAPRSQKVPVAISFRNWGALNQNFGGVQTQVYPGNGNIYDPIRISSAGGTSTYLDCVAVRDDQDVILCRRYNPQRIFGTDVDLFSKREGYYLFSSVASVLNRQLVKAKQEKAPLSRGCETNINLCTPVDLVRIMTRYDEALPAFVTRSHRNWTSEWIKNRVRTTPGCEFALETIRRDDNWSGELRIGELKEEQSYEGDARYLLTARKFLDAVRAGTCRVQHR